MKSKRIFNVNFLVVKTRFENKYAYYETCNKFQPPASIFRRNKLGVYFWAPTMRKGLKGWYPKVCIKICFSPKQKMMNFYYFSHSKSISISESET